MVKRPTPSVQVRAEVLVRRYLLSLLAVVASASLLASYFAFHIGTKDQIWSNIIAEAVAACWIFIIIHFVLVRQGVELPRGDSENKYGALVGFSSSRDHVNWSEVMRRAQDVTFITHYYNRWARAHFDDFVAFFAKGGRLRLIMSDPEDPQTLDAVNRYFFPGNSAADLKARIFHTESLVRQALVESGTTRGRVEVRYLPQILHYPVILAENRHLYLSVSGQFQSHVVMSPVFHIDLALDQDLSAYWHGQIQQYVEGSREAAT